VILMLGIDMVEPVVKSQSIVPSSCLRRATYFTSFAVTLTIEFSLTSKSEVQSL
jgi:hypothetical protein